MNMNASKLFTIVVVCLASAVVAQEQNNSRRDKASNGLSLNEIRDYRKMIRVNEKPMDMLEQTKFMCAPPLSVYGPHYDPGVVYYINETAKQGINAFSVTKQFPLGSIIVKEKQEQKTETSVQIITVMKKIRPEMAEDAWEYKMYDAKKWTEVSYEKGQTTPFTKTCSGCHRQYKNNDYVSDKGMELLFKK